MIGYGVPIALAGTLSLLISARTNIVGMMRHWRAGGAFADAVISRFVILPLAKGALFGAPLGALLTRPRGADYGHSRKLADLVRLEGLRQARLGLIGSLDIVRYFNYDRNMETKNAVEALSALAQEHRLAVFRLLVCEGPNGLPAGEIAERIAVPPSTLSHHLAHLERAGLLRSWRVERRIFYAVDIEGTRRLVTFLTEDCCRGRPDMCGYASRGGYRDDHDLSQPGLRDVAECPCDDPELG